MFQLSVQDIHPSEQAGNKEEVIRQIAAALVQEGNLADGYGWNRQVSKRT